MKKVFLLAFVLVLLPLMMFEARFVVPLKAIGEPSIEIWTDCTLDRDVTFDYNGFIVRANNVVLDLNGHTITGSGWGTGVDLRGSGLLFGTFKVTVQNGVIKNFEVGITDYQGSGNNSIVSNTIIDCTTSGILSYGTSNKIICNNIINTTNGIAAGNCSLIKNNYLVSGHIVVEGEGNSIINNTVMDSYIELYGYGGNTLMCNRITNCSWWTGIEIHQSNGNIIIENTVTRNAYGIRLWSSNDSVIYYNDFINNTQQVYSSDSMSTWDNGYPYGGNYWSDYAGVDSDADGIGDTEYEIDSNNIDHYPLMGMFSDFNATSEYHVQTICNSTISDLQFNGTAIMFNVTGVDGTTGFCRICIPTGLMNVTYRVFVNGTEVSCNLLICSNSTHSYLYFNYTHSTKEVIIIPEFPSLLILLLFMTATLLAVTVCKRKRPSPKQ